MADVAAASQQYLTFALAGEEYALPILRVREILEYDTVTHVPTTPPFIRGVMNLRGSVVPVIDLELKLGIGETAVTRRTCIVVVELPHPGDGAHDGEVFVVGLMAEAVNEVIDLAASEIVPPPEFGTPVRMEFLRGLGKTGKKFVLVLDIDRVMSTYEMVAVSSLSQPEAAGEGA
ncbi:MAG: chemotaxis protein CheW [Acidobacteriota bacterium]